MADPIISSVAAPSTVNPGEAFDVKIDASDPDAKSYSFDVTVTDKAGNKAAATITLEVQDPLTYEVVDPSGEFSIVQDAVDPSLFHVTAP